MSGFTETNHLQFKVLTMTQTRRIGGSFAPPLTAEELAEYKSLAADAIEPVRDEMNSLIKMCEVFFETPESMASGSPHPSGRGVIVPLEDAEVKRIWDFVPWEHEIESIAKLFESIDAVMLRDLRNAAFHLLWFARELVKDREPITNDKI